MNSEISKNPNIEEKSEQPIIQTEKDNPNIGPQGVPIINFSLEELEEIKRIHELKVHSAMIKTKHHKSSKEDHSKFRQIEYKDIPNYKRSLIVSNLPPKTKKEEIKEFFNTYLVTLNKKKGASYKSSVTNIEFFENGAYISVTFNSSDECRTCLALDNTDWLGYRMKIRTPKRFFDEYNVTQGQNVKPESHFNAPQVDNKLYLGGIPEDMTEEQIKGICESFGMLKSFNLIRDQSAPEFHRGFAFIEYVDEKTTERAMKNLNGFEIADKRLRIQKTEMGKKPVPKAIIQPSTIFYSHVKPEEKIPIPIFTITPSKIIQFLNLVTPEDLFDDEELEEIQKEVYEECSKFGEVTEIKIPQPDKKKGTASSAIGKVFVRFKYLLAAKQARYRLSGRKFNKKTVVASFYPEQYYEQEILHIV